MLTVDSQVHVWERASPQRPWPHWGAALDHGRGEPLRAERVLVGMERAGVDRAVLVPPSFEGDYNDVALRAARDHPHRFGVMGRLPLDDPASRDGVAGWLDQPGMLGIRLVFVHGGSADWLRDGTADWFWPAAESAGIPVAVHAPGQLDRIAAVARDHPRLRLAVDHLGIATGVNGGLAGIVAPLLALADLPNVAVKASALPCFTTERYPFPELAGLVRTVVRAFGAERVFWGSDLSRLPCPYEQVVSFFSGLLPGPQRDLVMGGAVLRWLGWDR